MHPQKIWANLAVNDIERTTKFYTDLGFKPNNAHTKELTSFFIGADNFVVHFFRKDILKANSKGEIANLKDGSEVIFSLSAESKDEVDQWMEAVKKAGATIYAEPENFEKGYFFGFSDPDGHKFNVLYWPDK